MNLNHERWTNERLLKVEHIVQDLSLHIMELERKVENLEFESRALDLRIRGLESTSVTVNRPQVSSA